MAREGVWVAVRVVVCGINGLLAKKIWRGCDRLLGLCWAMPRTGLCRVDVGERQRLGIPGDMYSA